MRGPGPGFPSWGGFCAASLSLCFACLSGSPPGLATPSSPGAATPPPKPEAPAVLSSYRAPLGCPSQQEYLEAVESRSATLRLLPELALVGATPESNVVRVRIQPDTSSAGWIGVLRIEGAAALEREVRGERCQDVTLALALITVLRLDRRESAHAAAGVAAGAPGVSTLAAASASVAAGSAALPAPAAPSAVVAPATAAAAEPAAAAAAAAPAASAAAAPSAPAAPDSATLPVAAAASAEITRADPDVVAGSVGDSRELSSRHSAEAEATLEPEPFEIVRRPRPDPATIETAGESAPGAATQGGWSELEPVLAAQLGYASAPSDAFQARLQAELKLAPELGWVATLGVSYSASGHQSATADLDFRLLAAHLELCPLHADGGWLWLRACGAIEGGAGRVSARANDLSIEPESHTRPWLAVGPSLHAGLPLSSHWSLRALVAGSLVLSRDSFDVARTVGGETGQDPVTGYTTLYRPPPVSLDLLLGVGYAF